MASLLTKRGEVVSLYDVITIGSATIDVFANTSSQLVKFITEGGEKDFISYPLGSKIVIEDLDFLVGGGGTNTAVSFAHLGLKTAFLGKIGDDNNGAKVLDLLKREHIDFIGRQYGQNGYSIILDSIEHDRTILTFKGCNNDLGQEDINAGLLNSKWLYSSSMVGKSFETLKIIFKEAKRRGIKVAFNPSNYQAKLGWSKLEVLLTNCDVLVLNFEEAQLLLGLNLDSEVEAVTRLGQKGLKYVVVTNGAMGAVCYYNNKTYFIKPNNNIKVVETTGAGDAFASAFVTGLIYEKSVEESLKLGLIQSESVIGVVGAKNNLLSKKDAFEKLNLFKGEIIIKEAKEYVSKNSTWHELPEFYKTELKNSFIFDDGRKIQGLEELGYYLEFMSDAVYKRYVYAEENHFATWVQEVFNLEELAQNMRNCENKLSMSKLIISFVHTKEKVRNI